MEISGKRTEVIAKGFTGCMYFYSYRLVVRHVYIFSILQPEAEKMGQHTWGEVTRQGLCLSIYWMQIKFGGNHFLHAVSGHFKAQPQMKQSLLEGQTGVFLTRTNLVYC